MINFTIDEKDLTSGLNNAIEDLFEKVNFEAIYRGIGEVLLTAVEDQFESQGAYFGSKWANLAPSTIKNRERLGKWPGSILQVSGGGLRASFTHSIVGNSVIISNNKSYAKYLHYGTSKMPARPFFSTLLNEEVKEEIRDVISMSLK